MKDVDAYFTQTVVGAPFSTVLGTRLRPGGARGAVALSVQLDAGAERLSEAWQDSVLLHADAIGPRPLPRGWRAWLERHALLVAGLGLVCLGTSLIWNLGARSP
ncbi:MAG: hypothetical protein JNJ71_06750 [Rubrivivax sp.]|nr:hypothetical protein [Rubrivivax sp.]